MPLFTRIHRHVSLIVPTRSGLISWAFIEPINIHRICCGSPGTEHMFCGNTRSGMCQLNGPGCLGYNGISQGQANFFGPGPSLRLKAQYYFTCVTRLNLYDVSYCARTKWKHFQNITTEVSTKGGAPYF